MTSDEDSKWSWSTVFRPALMAAAIMTRYSRRCDDGVVECHASKEELNEAAWREARRKHRTYGAVLGAIAGAVLAGIWIEASAVAYWPKWLRFACLPACLLAAAGIGGVIRARLATILLGILSLLILSVIAIVILGVIWDAV